jgi:Cu+-exporting ATPase
MEKISKLNYIFFDKTGTLTAGVPTVTDVFISEKINELDFWRLVGSAEADSEHSLGRCIAEYAKGFDNQLTPPTKFKALSGMGIRCVIDGKKVSIGNRKLMDTNNILIPQNYEEKMKSYENQGKTTMAVALDTQFLGLIAVSDTLRPEAQSVINYLLNKNITPIILSGDNYRTVSAIAHQLNIDTYYAEVFPGDKKDKVQALQNTGNIVGMVGDGINDAPALSQADVGIAVGSGTDVALESASVVLIRTRLTDIILALDISAVTYKRIKINFGWAFMYNLIAVPIAAGLFYPLLFVTLPPWVAGLAMALSSISVLLSSLLLKRYTPPPEAKPSHTSLIDDE